jgi:nitrite reductase/ring-hydroxylating ferredoxin subunit
MTLLAHNIKSKIAIFLLLILLPGGFISCTDNRNPIPYVPVNLFLYLNDPLYIGLNTIGSAVYITGGVNGIIVYRESQTQFRAFDRTCTNEPQGSCAVEKDNSGIIVVCPCCNSEFYLVIDGQVKKGPAEISLLEYSATFDGEKIHIYN